MERQSSPDTRIIPMAPEPLGVESAAMVFTIRMYDTSFPNDLLVNDMKINVIYSIFPKEKSSVLCDNYQFF
jgi:hypothetical protein